MIPSVFAEQMRKIDELAEKHFGLDAGMLMENAGRSAAMFVRDKLGIQGRKIAVLAGKGNNGGDALVAARFLHNWGADVHVIFADHPDNFSQLTKWHSGVLRSMFVELLYQTSQFQCERVISECDLVIDGLIGYNLSGNPSGFYANLINMANKKKILAVDVPTGLNADTGDAYEPCIKAKWTITMALPKKGLLEKKAKDFVGELWVADIGVPHEVYELMGLAVPKLFKDKDIVKC